MLAKPNLFRSHEDLFRKYIQTPVSKSTEYGGLISQLDSLLLLADRILVACDQHPDLNGVNKVGKALDDFAKSVDANSMSNSEAEYLLEEVEKWLKAIIWLVLPNAWQHWSINNKFSLAIVLTLTDLLQHNEIALKSADAYQIPDSVRKLVFIGYRYRNHLTHGTEEVPAADTQNIRISSLLILIAPLYKHRDALEKRLQGLITAPILPDDLNIVLSTIAGERQGHLRNFVGREQWIARLTRELKELQQADTYLVLLGSEGTGKSAICATISERLSSGSGVLGASATNVRKCAPWLPGVLLHFGKESNNSREIVQLLIAQANTMLLDPIQMIDSNEDSTQQLINRLLDRSEGDFPDVFPLSSELSLKSRYSSDAYRSDTIKTRTDNTSVLMNYRRIIYHIMERVIQERGSVTLIIDALNEISPDGTGLEFLPEHLPSGAVALLTTQPGTEVETWLRNRQNMEFWQLTPLERADIPLVTGVPDIDGADQRIFNDQVMQSSNGLPLLVVDVGREVQHKGGNFKDVRLGDVNTTLERQASKWIDQNPGEQSILYEVLILLAIFEPIASLNLAWVQSFLEHQGKLIRLPELRRKLHKVGAQLLTGA